MTQIELKVSSLYFVSEFTTITTEHPCPGEIRIRNPSRRAAADSRFRPHDHWEQQLFNCVHYFLEHIKPELELLIILNVF
jgi:hypothetical protein